MSPEPETGGGQRGRGVGEGWGRWERGERGGGSGSVGEVGAWAEG